MGGVWILFFQNNLSPVVVVVGPGVEMEAPINPVMYLVNPTNFSPIVNAIMSDDTGLEMSPPINPPALLVVNPALTTIVNAVMKVIN